MVMPALPNLCPACLSLGLGSKPAVVQVAGTLYCQHHGVEALAMQQHQQTGRGMKVSFTRPDSPGEPTIVAPPSPPTPVPTS